MMTGEQLGVGHEPRHGTAYVSSWIKALENDPKEIRAAAVDAQRISDWLMARERERSLGNDKAEQEQPSGGGETREHGDPTRSPHVASEARDQPRAEHDAGLRGVAHSRPVIDPAVDERQRHDGPSR